MALEQAPKDHVNPYDFSCRRRNHRSSQNNLNSSNIQEKPGSQHKSLLKKGREHNINGYVHSHSNASNATNSSLLKRRIIFSILAVCITLSKTSLATTETEISNVTPPHSDLESPNCTKAAVEEFPSDFLNANQRQNGGIIIHFLIALYLIFALGNICDDYFVPVLEIICETFNLSDDVAGATFMAAGTSAPEFFTNVMGTFVTKSDLGIGTIVGSAVFNIFGVISVCGLFAGKKITLEWYPITRDCVVYGITVLLLIIVLLDEKVFWYESIILISFYFLYIGIMFCNTRIENWAFSTQRKVKKRITNQTIPNESTPLHHTAADKAIASSGAGGADGLPVVAITSASMEFISNNTHIDECTLTVTGNDYHHMLKPQTSATPSNISDQTIATDTTTGSDSNLLPSKSSTSIDKKDMGLPTSDAVELDDAGVEEITINSTTILPCSKLTNNEIARSTNADNLVASNHNYTSNSHSIDVDEAPDDGEDDDDEPPKYPWERPDGGFFKHVWWLLFFPVEILFFLTIPDVRRHIRRPLRSATVVSSKLKATTKATIVTLCFSLTILWIGAISYVVTWMITVIGFTLSVPDTVMGLSFLAVGTSIPEMFSSFIVTRQGKGSMAVSNSIGSNTFDILICLGIPWLFRAISMNTRYHEWFVRVHSRTLNFTVGSLFASLVILYVMFLAAHWILSRPVAFLCMTIYFVFLTISLLFEMNVITTDRINKRICKSDY